MPPSSLRSLAPSLALIFSSFTLVSQAEAQPSPSPDRVALLPVRGDADAGMSRRARDASRAALVRAGFVPRDAPGCDIDACGVEAASAMGAAFSAGVLVWRPTPYRAAGKVEVILTDRMGDYARGEAAFSALEVEDAATQATEAALRAFPSRGGVPFEIEGPEGAVVLVDGRPVGALPHRGTLRVGAHRVRVVADGFVPWEREARAEPGGEGFAWIVQLVPHDRGVREGDAPSRTRRGRALRIGMGASGSAALAWVGVARAREGCAERDQEGHCRERRELRRGAALGVGAAGLALVGVSIGWAIRARRKTGPTLTVDLRPTGIRLGARF